MGGVTGARAGERDRGMPAGGGGVRAWLKDGRRCSSWGELAERKDDVTEGLRCDGRAMPAGPGYGIPDRVEAFEGALERLDAAEGARWVGGGAWLAVLDGVRER